jgi:outer membrane protein OmpA-like peptidoglycan-associated protein
VTRSAGLLVWQVIRLEPAAHGCKIGGYTDTTGDAAANLALFDARAKNVMDGLAF